MNEMMTFPDTWEEFEKLYGFNDVEEIYTNNSRLIPSFRVKQWLDHLPSVQPTHEMPSNTFGALDISGLDEEIRCTMCKNPMRTDRGCDGGCKYDEKLYADIMKVLHGRIKELPSVPRKGKWIITSTFDDCYYAKCDQCHETQVFYYNKPLTNFCPNCGCRMEEGDPDEKD